MKGLRRKVKTSRGRARMLMLAGAVALVGAGIASMTALGASAPPSNTAPPQVVGTQVEGMQLTATQGSWDEDPTSFAYQWQRCSDPSDATTCANISGATGVVYVLQDDDVGNAVRVRVIANNDMGDSAPAFSAMTGAIANAEAPGNTAPPQVNGPSPPEVGAELTANPGTWTGVPAPTFSYQWLSCTGTDVPADCSAIGSATGQTYTPVGADLGKRIAVAVTAMNVEATTGPVYSGATAPVAASTRPVNTVPPVITGSPNVGETLTSTQGAWTTVAPPLMLTYQWLRCDAAGQNCVDIAGATGQTYELKAADADHRIAVAVTAEDQASKETTATSTATPLIGTGPVNSARPTISGNPRVGELLTGAVGTWENGTQLTYTYQWQRCNAQGQSCGDIPGATGRTYRVTSADLGSTLVLVVTGRDASGATTEVSSVVTQLVAGIPAGQTVSIDQVSLPDRLQIAESQFQPRILRSRDPFTARFLVTDTQGHPVSGADVYLVAVPYGRVAPPGTVRTDANGWATFTLRPTSKFPLIRGYLITIFARATKPGGDLLAGVSARRLVSVRIDPTR